MQQYHEMEELMISLLDLTEGEIKTISSSLAKTFVVLYEMCDKGKGKYG